MAEQAVKDHDMMTRQIEETEKRVVSLVNKVWNHLVSLLLLILDLLHHVT